MKSALLKLSLAAGGLALVAGCVGVKAHKGAVIDQQLAAAIQPGIDNKDSVAKTLGRPSFTGEFDVNDWYYLSRDTNAFAFRNPRVTRQAVLHIHFDRAGNVDKIDHSGKETIASIDPAHGKTPTLGRKRSFFDELFGNIGTVGSGGLGGGKSPGP